MLTAIIVAAGSSRRIGFDKLFETIAGKTVIAHTIDAFELADSVAEIIVVTQKDRCNEIQRSVAIKASKRSRPLLLEGNIGRIPFVLVWEISAVMPAMLRSTTPHERNPAD